MIITYKFDMSDPEEWKPQRTTDRAIDLRRTISDLDQWLRDQVKYGAIGPTESAMQLARDQLWEILNDRDLKGMFE
jgi:hypothetical protein